MTQHAPYPTVRTKNGPIRQSSSSVQTCKFIKVTSLTLASDNYIFKRSSRSSAGGYSKTAKHLLGRNLLCKNVNFYNTAESVPNFNGAREYFTASLHFNCLRTPARAIFGDCYSVSKKSWIELRVGFNKVSSINFKFIKMNLLNFY